MQGALIDGYLSNRLPVPYVLSPQVGWLAMTLQLRFSHAHSAPLQINLFIAVLKIKFAKSHVRHFTKRTGRWVQGLAEQDDSRTL